MRYCERGGNAGLIGMLLIGSLGVQGDTHRMEKQYLTARSDKKHTHIY